VEKMTSVRESETGYQLRKNKQTTSFFINSSREFLDVLQKGIVLFRYLQ